MRINKKEIAKFGAYVLTVAMTVASLNLAPVIVRASSTTEGATKASGSDASVSDATTETEEFGDGPVLLCAPLSFSSSQPSTQAFNENLSTWSNASLSYWKIDGENGFPETFEESSYNQHRPLGIAGNFGIVAFGTLHNNADTASNMLVNELFYGSDAGTKEKGEKGKELDNGELSYIRELGENRSSYQLLRDGDKNILVVGPSINVYTTDNGNAFALNQESSKVDKPKQIARDAKGSFIVLTDVQDDMEKKSANFAGRGDCYAQVVLGQDAGSETIKVDKDHVENRMSVVNVKAEDFTRKAFVTGLSRDYNDTTSLLINIDAEDAETVELPTIRPDGASANETSNFGFGKIIVNIYSSTSSDGMFSGTVETGNNCDFVYATILAPDATIKATKNVNGSIIGNDVTITGENHRTDFIGSTETPGTPTVTPTVAPTKSPTESSIESKPVTPTESSAESKPVTPAESSEESKPETPAETTTEAPAETTTEAPAETTTTTTSSPANETTTVSETSSTAGTTTETTTKATTGGNSGNSGNSGSGNGGSTVTKRISDGNTPQGSGNNLNNINNNDVPLGNITIPDSNVPEGESVDIQDAKMPLGNLPKTGEAKNAAALLLTLASGLLLLIGFMMAQRKEKR